MWQQVLNDGFTDLSNDVDHDLRARFRAVTEDIERQIDSCDPTLHWAEIGADVEDAVATAVGDNFVWAYQRGRGVGRRGRPLIQRCRVGFGDVARADLTLDGRQFRPAQGTGRTGSPSRRARARR